MIRRQAQQGFTMVEMIMVIVITGIIGSIVAVFLQAPVQQYMDVARRADMTDIADTALRRVSRDLRLALPNSVRVSPDGMFIEFLPTGSPSCAGGAVCLGGGRYRVGAGGTNDELRFDIADNSFEVLGQMPTMVAGATPDQIVVYNLGITGADAYAGVNRAAVAAPGGIVTIAATQFPFDSPGHRFHVVSTPVSYVCVPAPGGVGGTLWRYWGYAIQPGQPSTLAALNALALPATATRGVAQLATNVSICSFTYTTNVVAQRSGLVTMNLGITRDGETVTLYSATHVSNQP